MNGNEVESMIATGHIVAVVVPIVILVGFVVIGSIAASASRTAKRKAAEYMALPTRQEYMARNPSKNGSGKAACAGCGCSDIYIERSLVGQYGINVHVCRQCGEVLYKSPAAPRPVG